MDWGKFKNTLELTHQFPTEFKFKFVLKKENRDELVALLNLVDFQEKDSAQGNYVSINFISKVLNSDSIVEIYQKAATIKGIILL